MAIISPSLAFAQSDSPDFGTRFLPSKLIQDQEGVIQVFAKKNNLIVPENIQGLTVTSLDSTIIRVISVKENDSGFVSEVTVNAKKPGTTKLFLAAPGFTPLELPVIVYGNKLNQEKFLVKAVPDKFSSNGPFRGVISVELADADGFPIIAAEDIAVSLSVPNNKVDIFQKNLVIKKGEYYSGTQFTVKESGTATIFATGQGLKGESNVINIDKDENALTLKLFTFPKQINISSKGTVGHIVALLHQTEDKKINESSCNFASGSSDDECKIVLAKKDITVRYKVTNSIFDNTNISNNAEIGESTGTFTIKKGTYWGHATFDLLGGDENFAGTYDVTISSGDPISLDTESVQAVFDENKRQEGDKFVKLDTLPIFASGNKELIGVVHLEDETNYPIVADKNLDISIDSTDQEFVSVDPVTIRTGYGSALVFANIGHTVPDNEDNEIELNAVVEINNKNPQLVETVMYGPQENSRTLVVEPLISKILADSEFPLVLYLKDGGVVTKFPENTNLFVTPSNIFEVQTKMISKGDDLIMLDSKSIGKGTDTLKFTAAKSEANVKLQSLAVKPASIDIDHSDTIFSGNNDIFSIQLLNQEGMPVFATEDVEIKLVVKDESLIQVPSKVVVKKGNYFSLFDVAPKKSGFTEISALTEDFPLSSTDIVIKDLTPKIDITVPTIVEQGEAFVASIDVKQDTVPLQNLNVKWNVDGGGVQISDSKTGPTGKASASIIPTSNQKVIVQASVSGSYYSPAKISKTVQVNATSEFMAFAEDGNTQEYSKFEIAGIDPVIIIIPLAIGVVGYMLRKQGSFKITKPAVPVQNT